MKPGLLDGYAAWVTRHPWTVLLAALVFTALLAAGTARLEFRQDNRVFFSDNNPELQALEEFEAVFGHEDTLIFIVTVADGQGDLFTPPRLAALNELTEQAWRMPHVKRVTSVTNFQRVAADGDLIVIDHLARQGDPLTPEQARALGQVAGQEPLLSRRLLSPDGRAGLVVVNFRLQGEDASGAVATLMSQARQMMAAFRQANPQLAVGLSGSVALDNAFGEAAAADGALLTPVMLTVILLLVGLLLRSWTAILGTTLVMGGAIAAALGAAGLLGIPLSSPSVAAPYVILILATADCIHLVTAALRRARQGLDRVGAVAAALAGQFRPITLTSLTTAIGFFSLVFSESPPFRHLGLISGMGAVLAWFLAITALPALLALLPWRAPRHNLEVERLCAGVAGLVAVRPGQVAVGMVVLAGLLGTFAFSNNLDDRYVRYFDDRFQFRQDTDLLNRHLGGFYRIEYALAGPGPGGVADPVYLSQLDALAHWLRQQPGVTHVDTLAEVIKTIHRAMEGGNEAAYALPAEREVAAQYLMLYEMSLPVGLDLKETVSVDKSLSRVSVSLADLSTGEMLELAERTRIWAGEHTPLLATSLHATGTSMLFAHIGQRNIQGMLIGTLVALLLISGLLLMVFRSLLLGVAGLVANLAPCLIALGGWALVVGEVGMAVATIAAVTLGIVVDDTIHLIAAAQRARRGGEVPAGEAVREALTEAGPGMLTTTLVLTAGFACLALSGFQINAWMGLMTAIVIAVALPFDFLFLSAVLSRFTRWK